MDTVKIDLRRITPLTGPTPAVTPGPASGRPAVQDFHQVLQQETERVRELKFSQHAQDRLAQRQIDLSPDHLQRLQAAVDRAASKGARDSLVLIDDLALVVSIRNRTVITALGGPDLKENIITNIDSAVII